MENFIHSVKYFFRKFCYRIKKFFVKKEEEPVPEEKPNDVKMFIKQMPKTEILKYDKNRDGKIDVEDVRGLVDDILSGKIDFSMDVNNDGDIDISDVVGLVNIILQIDSERELSANLFGYDFVRQPANMIYYKTYNNKPCDVFNPDGFGAKMVSNDYSADLGYGIIEFEKNITAVPDHAFYFGTELVNLSIPKKVVNIGAHAFANCKRLESIVLAESVERINLVQSLSEGGSFAFDDCVKLKNIVSLAKKAPAIDWSTFRDMGSSIEDRILYVVKGSTGYETWMEVGTGISVMLGNYGFEMKYI